MINNVSIKEMGEYLSNAKSVILFPHENADGDAAGSCGALCMALRQKGIECWILCDGPLAGYIDFLDCGYFTTDINCIEEPDVCASIDCSEDQRITGREAKYHSGKIRLCIDHHATAGGYGDYYYNDGDEAATAQIIYDIICSMMEADENLEFTRYMTNAIFTAISSDTGNFQYSNTSSRTHRIAAELMDIGVDHNDIIVNLYQNKNAKNIAVETKAMSHMELFADGKAAISYITADMLEECDASFENSEEVINMLRDISGVEIAAFLKVREPELIKVSLRAKSYGDVGSIAQGFGGGGHVKAAGCTLRCGLEEAMSCMKEAIIKGL